MPCNGRLARALGAGLCAILLLGLVGACTASGTAPSEESPDSARAVGAEGVEAQGFEVGFELVKHQIVLEAHLGDFGPYNMLLDTGVTPSGLDLDVARETGLLQGEEPVGRAGGVGGSSVPIFPAEIRDLRLGDSGLRPAPFPAVAMDLGLLGERLGRPLHGILGHAFLKRHRVRIDYPGRTVTLDGPVPRAEADGRRRVYRSPLQFVEGDIMPLLPDLRVNGVEVPVSLDTGGSPVLELYPEGARLAGIEPTAGDSVTVTGARGDEETGRGRARTIALGPLIQLDREVLLPHAARPGANRKGNLGNGFLERYVVTVDYLEATVMIEEVVP